MNDRTLVIITAEDGREIRKEFDTREEAEAFLKFVQETAGSEFVKTIDLPEQHGLPSVEAFEEIKE